MWNSNCNILHRWLAVKNTTLDKTVGNSKHLFFLRFALSIIEILIVCIPAINSNLTKLWLFMPKLDEGTTSVKTVLINSSVYMLKLLWGGGIYDTVDLVKTSTESFNTVQHDPWKVHHVWVYTSWTLVLSLSVKLDSSNTHTKIWKPKSPCVLIHFNMCVICPHPFQRKHSLG